MNLTASHVWLSKNNEPTNANQELKRQRVTKPIPLPGQNMPFEVQLLVGVGQTAALWVPSLLSAGGDEIETMLKLANEVIIRGKICLQN